MIKRHGMWGRVGVMGLWSACVAGCLTREALYEDLRETRDAAYESWLRLREDGEMPIPAEKLSLDEAVRIALLYNKSLQAKIQEREVARGELVAAYQLALPRVDAAASTAYGNRDADSANLSFRQPVFRGGGATAGLRAAKLFAFWSDESVRNTVQTVIKQVTADYYGALLADNLCQVNRDAVVSAEAHLNDVRIKRVNGVASKYDELRAQVDVANFRAEMIRQENNLVLAKTGLLRTLGTATDAPIRLADELRHEPISTTLEQAIETAYANRPDLYMAELNIRMQRERVRAIRGSYLPEIDLALSAGTDRARDGDGEWAGTQRAALELTWPLFDGFGREGQLIAARARLRQREIELKSVEEDVFLDVQQALLNLKNAEEYVESQRLNLQHAEEGLRLAMTGYREGVNTEVEVVDARSSLTEARGNYYRALYDHSMARLALQQATGTLEKHLEQE
ncbi:MAG TPA: TolC family protein [Kiritimatiellia bacterium]|nr:TolC family protein [Kiritimatiellia bacterium]HQQ91283.1 TolC family protein [Kiritimatiellia bacterium]